MKPSQGGWCLFLAQLMSINCIGMGRGRPPIRPEDTAYKGLILKGIEDRYIQADRFIWQRELKVKEIGDLHLNIMLPNDSMGLALRAPINVTKGQEWNWVVRNGQVTANGIFIDRVKLTSTSQGYYKHINIIVSNISLNEGGEWEVATIASHPNKELKCNLNTGEGCVLTVDEVTLSVQKRENCKDQIRIPWPKRGIIVVPTHETVVQGVGWTYYPIMLDFNYFMIPLRCSRQQREWFKGRTQEIIDEWTETKRRDKRDTIATILGGVGTGLGVWNSADIIGLNSRINSLTDGFGHAMKTGGVADSLIVEKLGDNVDDIHTIAHNLQLVEENIADISNSIKNEEIGAAIFCSMTGNKLLSDLKDTINDIKGNKWTEKLNATKIIATLRKKGVIVTEDNLKHAYIEGPGQWLPEESESGRVGLILAIPRWEGEAEPLNFVHSIGTFSQSTYQQHFPSKKLATITEVVIDEGCCKKVQHRWLCTCTWETRDIENGWVQFTKAELVREVIHIGDMACFIGHKEYKTSDETCPVEEGTCVRVTTPLHVGTHTVFPSGNLTTDCMNFTEDTVWENWTLKLFPPIPKLTLQLHELVQRTKQQLRPISNLLEQQNNELEKTKEEVIHPWWGVLTDVETHPIMRTLSLMLMFIQVITTAVILYFCVILKKMKRKLKARNQNDFI
ncbi:uncharacterized protein LOC128640028 [Bombina bombina]|uniref:uncharacterized protein LOC128640028 n=1 Tax=Bombina bombina TaxID=8345 RepID=UPI00235B07C0|nr:uncharacterized protein LOC128640028 [Bombina bombina]